jgi:hypothetical protein
VANRSPRGRPGSYQGRGAVRLRPGALWGRAEAVRTFLRQIAEAGSPLLFGLIADLLAGGGGTAFDGSTQHVSAATARRLQYAFLIMLVPLAVNGLVILFRSRRTYGPDVATAAASERAPGDGAADGRAGVSDQARTDHLDAGVERHRFQRQQAGRI